MNFYSEWEAKQKYDDLLRHAHRRARWNLEGGLLPHEKQGVIGRVLRRVFGGETPKTIAATPEVQRSDAPVVTKKAS